MSYIFYSNKPLILMFFLWNFIILFSLILSFFYLNIFIFIIILPIILWLIILFLESLFGFHNYYFKNFFKLGFFIFLISEIMFFFSFFWFFFDNMMNLSLNIFDFMSPKNFFKPEFILPLFNTFLLLSSGFFLTIFHYYLLMKKKSLISFNMCILMGLMFIFIQMFEYFMMLFSMSDSSFGSIFFMLTGFHGLHIIIGLSFLTFNYFVYIMKKMNDGLSLSFSIIYWHFVDIIWLFLLILVYWYY